MECSRALPANVVDTGEIYDCVVVGGGISGLAAALIFQRKAGEGKTCLVLDNHPIFGGEAKRNEFLVDGHRLIGHQGSALFRPPYPAQLYRALLRVDRPEGATPRISEVGQARAGDPAERPRLILGSAPYGLYFGAKFGQPRECGLTDPWGKKLEGAPISAKAREELLQAQSPDPAAIASTAVSRRRHLAPARHDHARRPLDGEAPASAAKRSEHFSARRRWRLRSRPRRAFRLHRLCLR